MYAMTAAHPTLPLPSYARVTSVATGKSVVVRVNDRGPFLHGRIIDLSYAAAHRARHRAEAAAARSRSRRSCPATLAQSPQAPACACRRSVRPQPQSRRRSRLRRPSGRERPRDASGRRRDRRLRRAARRVCKFCQCADFPRACAEPTRDGGGRSRKFARRADCIASTSAPIRPATRRERIGGPHHAGIRIRDDDRAALSASAVASDSQARRRSADRAR